MKQILFKPESSSVFTSTFTFKQKEPRARMSFRLTLEILEADGLLTPATGGQPLSAFHIAVRSRPEVSQSTRQLPGKKPVWCERFVLEGCQETDVVALTLTDYSFADKEGLVGKCEFAVGGPRRQVGSKWVELAGGSAPPSLARVRVLWEVAETLDWSVRQPTDRMASIPVTERVDPDAPLPTPQPTTDAAAAAAAAQRSDTATLSLTAQIAELRHAVSGRMGFLEARMQSVEELFATRRDFDAKRRQEQLKGAGESHYGPSTFVPHPWVIASQQSAAAVKEIKYDPKTQSALQSILTSPTVVSAYDDQIFTFNTMAQVVLPKPRLIGFVPTSAPGAVRT